MTVFLRQVHLYFIIITMKPKLSVVIPAYNEGQRISQTLEETDRYLRKQNYGYEIIVVDNGSNDNTCDLVKEYQEKGVNLRQINLVQS